ncbi:hypothetical protein Sjap_022040 [Stephania japonica]|uniref:Uncharacterized protein n=1 Tax=Stephania japonica TaxID=461633 RepID=A0AAP0ETU0_9MAGN
MAYIGLTSESEKLVGYHELEPLLLEDFCRFLINRKMRLYCNHEEEATSISEEEKVDRESNIDEEEMLDGDANIDDEEMVDANIYDEEIVDANIDDEDEEMVDANIHDEEMVEHGA